MKHLNMKQQLIIKNFIINAQILRKEIEDKSVIKQWIVHNANTKMFRLSSDSSRLIYDRRESARV